MTIHSLDVLLSIFGTSLVPCLVLSCFLTCIQISQVAGQVVWYSHLLKNFPQFVVIYTIKGLGVQSLTHWTARKVPTVLSFVVTKLPSLYRFIT